MQGRLEGNVTQERAYMPSSLEMGEAGDTSGRTNDLLEGWGERELMEKQMTSLERELGLGE